MTSAIVWGGPSEFDGSPLAVVLVPEASNPKTGFMAAAYILRSDMHPQEAIKTGADAGSCCPPDCPQLDHGDGNGRGCYWGAATRGLGAVGRRLMAGGYDTITAETGAHWVHGRPLRIGAYGDPAAVPVGVWEQLQAHADGFTSYTSAWRVAPQLAGRAQASVTTPEAAAEAAALGFKWYRVTQPGEELLPGEVWCPATAPGGKRKTCATCQLCNGARVNIAAPDHGPRSRRRLPVLAA